jgi:hypothetical protein
MRIVTIPVTQLRTGDRILEGNSILTLGKLLDYRNLRERAFAVGPVTEQGGAYVTWRASGTVKVIR